MTRTNRLIIELLLSQTYQERMDMADHFRELFFDGGIPDDDNPAPIKGSQDWFAWAIGNWAWLHSNDRGEANGTGVK